MSTRPAPDDTRWPPQVALGTALLVRHRAAGPVADIGRVRQGIDAHWQQIAPRQHGLRDLLELASPLRACLLTRIMPSISSTVPVVLKSRPGNDDQLLRQTLGGHPARAGDGDPDRLPPGPKCGGAESVSSATTRTSAMPTWK